MTFDEYRRHDGLALADLVRKSEVTPDELLEIAIRRLEEVNPRLNAVIHRLYDAARASLKTLDRSAPFAGVPFLVKDLGMEVKDSPLNAGCRGYRDYVSARDSFAVERMRRAGLVIFGKTNTPEFGLTPFTEPRLYGVTRNPHHEDHTPGGSSGGSAAAVAAGVAPLATANDGGGSIRIPASCCGLVGLKPSRGRVSFGPLMGEMWNGAVAEGCVSRTVRDTAAYLDAVQGAAPGDPYVIAPPRRPYLQEVGAAPGRVKIAWSTRHTLGLPVDAACLQAVDNAVAALRDAGHDVEEATPPYLRADLIEGFLVVIAGETAAELATLARYLGRPVGQSDVEPNTYALALLGRTFTANDYAVARRRWNDVCQRAGEFHRRYDVLLTPTVARRPVRIGALQNTAFERRLVGTVNRLGLGRLALANLEQLADKIFDFIPWTAFANMTGQPSLSLPFFRTAEEGLPIGTMFTARLGEEDLLLRLAAQLESASMASLAPPRPLPG